MAQPLAPLLTLYAAAAVVALAVAVLALRRATPGARVLAFFLLAAAAWSGANLLEPLAGDLARRNLVLAVRFAATFAVPALALRLVLELTHRLDWLSRGRRAALVAWPVLATLAHWTNGWHRLHLAGTFISPETGLTVLQPGPLYWPILAVNYLLVLLALGLVLHDIQRRPEPVRAPLRLVALALALPLLGSLARVLGLGPWPGLDWAAVAFLATGLLFGRVILRHALLDPLPLARSLALSELVDGILVADETGHVLARNPAAARMLGADAAATCCFRGLAPLRAEATREEIRLDTGGRVRWLEVRSSPVVGGFGEPAGRVYQVADITAEREQRAEQERLIEELRVTLAEVEALQGLIPICASCKKIRDARGYWNQMAAYLEAHTNLVFAEARCPGCAEAAERGA